MIEIIFTRRLTIYNNSELLNLAFFFSRAKPLRSPPLVKFKSSFNFDRKRCKTSKGFRALFIYCICSKNDSFLSVFSKAAFLSFIFFFRPSIVCRRVFNKSIILLGLAGYEMIITISALRASLVIHTAISKNVVGENDECQWSNGDCTTEKKCGYWILIGNKLPWCRLHTVPSFDGESYFFIFVIVSRG